MIVTNKDLFTENYVTISNEDINNEQDSEFESFYVRPTNGRTCEDPVRHHRGCQYFFYPNHTFSYFRDHQITTYEAPANIDLDEWISLKAVIEDEKATFYLNDDPTPVLV